MRDPYFRNAAQGRPSEAAVKAQHVMSDDRRVPTRREIKAHLRATFPNLTNSAAERTAHAALDLRRVRPDVDVLRWAEADVERRRKLAGSTVRPGNERHTA